MNRKEAVLDLALNHKILKHSLLPGARDGTKRHTKKPVIREAVEVGRYAVDSAKRLIVNGETADRYGVRGYDASSASRALITCQHERFDD